MDDDPFEVIDDLTSMSNLADSAKSPLLSEECQRVRSLLDEYEANHGPLTPMAIGTAPLDLRLRALVDLLSDMKVEKDPSSSPTVSSLEVSPSSSGSSSDQEQESNERKELEARVEALMETNSSLTEEVSRLRQAREEDAKKVEAIQENLQQRLQELREESEREKMGLAETIAELEKALESGGDSGDELEALKSEAALLREEKASLQEQLTELFMGGEEEEEQQQKSPYCDQCPHCTGKVEETSTSAVNQVVTPPSKQTPDQNEKNRESFLQERQALMAKLQKNKQSHEEEEKEEEERKRREERDLVLQEEQRRKQELDASDLEHFGVGEWKDVTPLVRQNPIPSFSLDSVVCGHILAQWTSDRAKIQYLQSWLGSLCSSIRLPRSFPTGIQLVDLSRELRDGFIAIILPIVLESLKRLNAEVDGLLVEGKEEEGGEEGRTKTASAIRLWVFGRFAKSQEEEEEEEEGGEKDKSLPVLASSVERKFDLRLKVLADFDRLEHAQNVKLEREREEREREEKEREEKEREEREAQEKLTQQPSAEDIRAKKLSEKLQLLYKK